MTALVKEEPEEGGTKTSSFLKKSSSFLKSFPTPTNNSIYLSSLTESNLRLLDTTRQSVKSKEMRSSSENDMPRTSGNGRSVSYTSATFKFELKRRGVFGTMRLPPGWEEWSNVVNEASHNNELAHEGTLLEAQVHLLDASSESMVLMEVVPKLLPTRNILLSSQFEAVYTSLWKIDPLPSLDVRARRLPSPKPDVTIGYNWEFLGSPRAMEALSTFSTPVTCCSELAFPIFTLEAKGFGSTVYSQRQNMHNGACMLRNLCHLRSLARKGRENDNLVIFTASVSPEKVSLHSHWVENIRGQMTYPSREIRSWSPGSDNLNSAIETFSNIIYESLQMHATWIREDLQTLDLALEQHEGPSERVASIPSS